MHHSNRLYNVYLMKNNSIVGPYILEPGALRVKLAPLYVTAELPQDAIPVAASAIHFATDRFPPNSVLYSCALNVRGYEKALYLMTSRAADYRLLYRGPTVSKSLYRFLIRWKSCGFESFLMDSSGMLLLYNDNGEFYFGSNDDLPFKDYSIGTLRPEIKYSINSLLNVGKRS